jgi:hypothetical protein
MAQKTLADGLCAPVFPQYLASHYVYEGQNPNSCVHQMLIADILSN